jgi:hypothetical protein
MSSNTWIPSVMLSAALVLGGMASAAPTQAKLSSLPANVAVVYIPGTEEANTVTATGWQDQTKWLHRRLIMDLGASHSKAFTVNYYTTASLGGSSIVPNQLPEVRSVLGYASPAIAGQPACLKAVTSGVDEGDVLRHAYHTAWALSAQVTKAPSQKFLLIGHSQGGAIAKIIWILSNKTRRDNLVAYLGGTKSEIRPACWPANLTSDKVYGQIYMGAPISGVSVPTFDSAMLLLCTLPGFVKPAIKEMCNIVRTSEYAYKILQSTTLVPTRSVAYGGWKSELWSDLPLIPWELTVKNKVEKNIVVIPSADGTVPMAHSNWWGITGEGVYNGSGYCPKWLLFKTREFCGWSDAFNSSSSGAKPIFVVNAPGWTLPKNAGDPGNVYDLMIMRIKLDWS